jgi:hypothetical protein
MNFRTASHITNIIVDLNNDGILLLRQNKAKAALSCFTEGLSTVHQLVMDQFDGTLCSTSKDPIKGKRSSILSIPLFKVCNDFDSQSGSSSWTGESFAFYNRAFTLSSCIGTSPLTAILLFNSGLAHHVMAMQGTYNPSKKLQQALRCYKYALNVIRSMAPSSTKENLYVLTLALLNNMGHVYFCFSWAKEVHSCRDHLDALLEDFLSHILSDEDADFFYFEKMYREQGYVYSAAPAA